MDQFLHFFAQKFARLTCFAWCAWFGYHEIANFILSIDTYIIAKCLRKFYCHKFSAHCTRHFHSKLWLVYRTQYYNRKHLIILMTSYICPLLNIYRMKLAKYDVYLLILKCDPQMQPKQKNNSKLKKDLESNMKKIYQNKLNEHPNELKTKLYRTKRQRNNIKKQCQTTQAQ